MNIVVCFGELMLRLSPPGHLRIAQATSFDASFGGAEANVAVSLALLGNEARFVSRLPGNALGDAAVAALQARRVDTSRVLRGGERIGIYYLEHGAALRPSRVVYDRAHSACSELAAGDVDWAKVFDGATWFHISGITPALSPSCAAASLEAVRIAREQGIRVSCDLNYRKNLWSREEAGAVLSELTRNVDLLIANEEDAADVFGIHAEGAALDAGVIDTHAYEAVARALAEKTGAREVAITLRKSLSASDNEWSALLLSGGDVQQGPLHRLHVVDRVGSGDAFAAGLIHATLAGWDTRRRIDFAVAASALKHSIPGDWNLVSESEVLAVAGGDVGGRVKR